jgi:serine/threonine protein kinase
MQVYINGKPISLNQKDYVAEGGEGKVYTRAGIGYKIYHDPKKMIPAGKIIELQRITNPNIIRPIDIITNKSGCPIGYTMRFIKDAWSLCQVFPKAFRKRNNITHQMIQGMVHDLQDLIDCVHKAGILIVDANEMNFLLTKDFKVVLAIDADSYQTPHYPATAIMPSIRDWKIINNNWTEGSDWFSFACVSFQMFIGMHPYKGKHPTINGMEERMKVGISVLDPAVQVSPAAFDFGVIPPQYMEWYEKIFIKGERCMPPNIHGTVVIKTSKPVLMKGAGYIELHEIYDYKDDIIRYWTHGSEVIVMTNKNIWHKGRPVIDTDSDIRACGFTMSGAAFVAGIGEGKYVKYTNIGEQTKISYDSLADFISSYDERVYQMYNGETSEIKVTEFSNAITIGCNIVDRGLPNSSKLYPGVVIHSMLGNAFASLLVRKGASYQIKIPELDKYRILDAKYDSNVLMIIGEYKGKYDRLVIRFDSNYATYDLQVVLDIQPTGLNFVVLDSGVCVFINEEGKIIIFSKKKGSCGSKEINDPIIPGDAILGKSGGTVLLSSGSKLYNMRMVK